MKLKSGLVVVIVAILGAAAALLWIPGNQDRRDRAMQQDLIKIGFKVPTEAELERVRKAPALTIASKKEKIGDIYLFMPANGNHYMLLSDSQGNDWISRDFAEYSIHAIPVKEPHAPLASKVMKLGLLGGTEEGLEFIRLAGANEQDKVDSAWQAKSKSDQTRADQWLAENKQLSLSLGDYQAFVVHRSIAVKVKNWTKCINPAQQIRQYVHPGPSFTSPGGAVIVSPRTIASSGPKSHP